MKWDPDDHKPTKTAKPASDETRQERAEVGKKIRDNAAKKATEKQAAKAAPAKDETPKPDGDGDTA